MSNVNFRNRATTFLMGAIFGAVVTLSWGHGNDRLERELPKLAAQPDNTTTSTAPATSSSATTEIPVSQLTENQDTPDTGPIVQGDYENIPIIPSIYVEMLGPPVDKVTLQDLHATFGREPRHDAWAFEVESAIAQEVVDKGIAEWAVVEHIECRAMTCEIAGYYTGDGKPRAPKLVQYIDRAIWWHDHISSHTYNANPDGFDRFLTIVTAQSFANRTRPPRPLN